MRLSRRRRRSATRSRSCTTSSRDRPRPAQYDVIEFICCTTAPRRSTCRRQRLVCARLPRKSKPQKLGVLAACKNIMSAERWFAAAPARGDCPPALSVARQGRHTRSTWPSQSSGATLMAHASSICQRRHDLPRNTVSTLTVTSPAPSLTSLRSSMLSTCAQVVRCHSLTSHI